MINKRMINRKRNRVLEILLEHIKQNHREYTISVFVLLIGVVVGVILVNCSSSENKSDIMGYIGNFIQSIKSREYAIDGKKLLIKSITYNVRLALIIWGAGLTIIGMPIIYVSIAYKGMCIGYSISAIIATLGKLKGTIFSLSTMLLQNLIAVPCFLALMVSSMKMYKSVTINKNKGNMREEVCRHIIFSIFMIIGLLFASFLEYYFTALIFSDIIIKFV